MNINKQTLPGTESHSHIKCLQVLRTFQAAWEFFGILFEQSYHLSLRACQLVYTIPPTTVQFSSHGSLSIRSIKKVANCSLSSSCLFSSYRRVQTTANSNKKAKRRERGTIFFVSWFPGSQNCPRRTHTQSKTEILRLNSNFIFFLRLFED